MQLIPKVVADFEVQLATAISPGGTSFSISSATDDDLVPLPSNKYAFTIDSGTTAKEYFIGDLVGTTISNIYSISRQGVTSSGALRSHRVGASVKLTDFSSLQIIAAILRGESALDSASPIAYDANPTLSDGKQLATVAYVLSVVSGGTVNFSSQTIPAVAGESLINGSIVYFKESDQRWWKASALTSSTFDQVRLGIALGTASAGAGVTIQISGLCNSFTSLTPGAKYYLSDTSGLMSSVPGTTTVFLGTAVNTTTVLWFPQFIYWPTANEKTFLPYLADSQIVSSFTAGENISDRDLVFVPNILFDTVGTGSNPNQSSISFTHAVGAGVTILFVALTITTGTTNTSVTVNGVAMTLKKNLAATSFNHYVYYMINPPTGTVTIAVTNSGNAITNEARSISYIGGTTPDVDTTGNATTVTTLTTTLTTLTQNSWLLGIYAATASNLAAGTGATQRGAIAATALMDSNGPQTIGSKSMQVTASSGNMSGIMVTIVPIGATTIFRSKASQSWTCSGLVGIAIGAIVSGQSGYVVIVGKVTGLTGLVPGSTVYAADTAGQLSMSPGTNSRKVGIALSSTSMLVRPDNP